MARAPALQPAFKRAGARVSRRAGVDYALLHAEGLALQAAGGDPRLAWLCLAASLLGSGLGFARAHRVLVERYGFPYSVSTLKKWWYRLRGLLPGSCASHGHGLMENSPGQGLGDGHASASLPLEPGDSRRGRGVKRLGRTERLVVSVLSSLRRGATPAGILLELRGLGYRLSYKAVHNALRRLLARGVVYRVWRGLYALSPRFSGEDVLVENFRAGRYHHASVDGPKGLRLVLVEAWLSHLAAAHPPPVEQAEMYHPLPRGSRASWLWRLLRQLGLGSVVIYWNRDLDRLKVETRWAGTPWPAHPASHEQMLRAHKLALQAALQAIREATGLAGPPRAGHGHA